MPNIIEQIEVHSMAQFFYTRSGAAAIVIITNRPELVDGQFPVETKLFVVCKSQRTTKYQDKLSSLLPNAEFVTPSVLSDIFLNDKILVCIDYLEGPSVLTWLRQMQLKQIIAQPLVSIVFGKFSRILRPLDKPLIAGKAKRFSSSVNKDQSIALYGQLINIGRQEFPDLSVLAIMHVYNEQDVIADTIKHLIEQGVDVHVIDNWSTDNTYEIIQTLTLNSNRITYERFPAQNNNKFELAKMLTRVTEVARSKKQYKWVILNDADEIRWSPWQGISLQQAFSFIDSTGYNAVDYTVFNFVPTKEGFSAEQDLLSFFEYGEFSGLEGHFVQVKSWKNNPEASLAPSGGHHVNFPNLKIFPLKFFLGHYPIRSTQHALEKIFQERKSRFSEKERRKGWHVQYDDIDETTSFIGNEKTLTKFTASDFWEKFIVERISGVGIKRD